MLRADINCDLGEGGRDADVMPHITSASIACGGHTGDDRTMREALLLAAAHGVAAGAHPSYPDRDGFGRRSMGLTPREILEAVTAQLEAIRTAARAVGVPLAHVKPHGALYNDGAADAAVARAIVRAVADIDPNLRFFGLSGSHLLTEAERAGLRAVSEVFADRSYEADGTLTPRTNARAVIEDPEEAALRTVRMVAARAVRTRPGSDVAVSVGTICVHGDNPNAAAIARAVRAALLDEGVHVAAPGRP
jgi:UPF0271 protein